MSSDALRLRNMRFFAYHGLFPEETALGQHYEVDVELYGVGLLQLKDGSMLVSDDGGQKIWRVSYGE